MSDLLDHIKNQWNEAKGASNQQRTNPQAVSYTHLDKLETSLHPYTSVFYAPFLYVSDRFLNLSRSLEAYHRDFINNASISFVNRCKQIIKSNSTVYNSTLKIPSIPKFADNIKSFRNDFTH